MLQYWRSIIDLALGETIGCIVVVLDLSLDVLYRYW